MELTTKRPAIAGWYWYSLPGSWPLQPVFVFDGGPGFGLLYTIERLDDEDDKSRDGLALDLASPSTLWSKFPILPADTQIERSLRDLLATIELHTDCMTGQIDRAALDDYIEAAEKILQPGCGACGAACDGKGSCRVAGSSPASEDQEWLS
jgi:hypothetical protein